MTDSSALLPNQQAVSNDCLFNLKPSSVRARSYRASIASSNKSIFSPSDIGIFYIPGGRRNTYMDPQQSYIKFTVQNQDASGSNFFYVDNVGSSFINRIDIFHASNLLETIQQYNVLFSYLFDFQFTQSAKNGLSAMYGSSGIGNTYSRQGAPVFGNATAASGQKMTFCMPILSGTIGLGCDKLIPIGALSDDIRIEISWESQNIAVCYAAAPTVSGTNPSGGWIITQAELELTIIELSDEGESMVQSVTPFSQPVFLHGNSWRHYVSNLAAASGGGLSYLVPARFASLKSIVLCPRRQSEIATAVQTSYSVSSRVNPLIQTYWLRCGAYVIPNKYVILQSASNTGGYAEAYAEIQKSFHALTAPQYASGITYNQFNVSDALDSTIGGVDVNGGVVLGKTANNSYNNAFAIAQELETWSNRSDVIISGMNTLASQIFFEANLTGTTSANSYTFDFYANYDHILVLENGILSAKF